MWGYIGCVQILISHELEPNLKYHVSYLFKREGTRDRRKRFRYANAAGLSTNVVASEDE